MKQKRTRVPLGLPIAAVILIVLGVLAGPIIRSIATEDQMARNVLLSALPFILIFIGIILIYMTIIWAVASVLNDRVSARTYRIIEYIAIGGIVVGVVCMLQPWVFALFRYGFLLLLFSTIFFILWSHVRPRGAHGASLGTVSVTAIEQKELEG